MRPFLQLTARLRSRLAQEEHGQDLLEYGLLMALIAIVAVAAVGTVGQTIYNIFWKAIASSI